MEKTTPKLAFPLQPSAPHQREEVWSLAIYLTQHSLSYFKGPRWPSGKASALGPESPRFETRLHRRPAVYVAPPHAKSYAVVKRPNAGVALKFGEGGASPGVVLVI
ncbi:hypothetical protein AVEN_177349-1 [Araneus ventricosus]|uniref:Uncharacterized protein n=1 Tax=Araneus ventricosus TaxID=182803 RepID=A0A4Y2VBR4_ARAVE|nr:hypothetical protein AVEN_177349-1 [Araneus ventricosus]